MKKITTAAELASAIRQMEYKQVIDWSLLKEQILITRESLQPLNLIKNTFRDVTSSPAFKNDLISTAMGLTAGILSKALIIGLSHNPIKRLFGTILQLKVSNAVANNSETLTSLAGNFIKFFGRKKKTGSLNQVHELNSADY